MTRHNNYAALLKVNIQLETGAYKNIHRVRGEYGEKARLLCKFNLPVWKTHSPEMDFPFAPKENPWKAVPSASSSTIFGSF